MVAVALDRCSHCGGTLIGDFDHTSLRVLPVCINCGRSPAQAPMLSQAEALDEVTLNRKVFPDSRAVRIEVATDGELLTTLDVATDYQVAPYTISQAKNDGRLPYSGSLSRPRYRREDVEKWRTWAADFRQRRVATMRAKREQRRRLVSPDDLLTANDLADEFGFSRWAVFNAVEAGKLAPVDATAYRHQYRRSDVDAWRASGQGAHSRAEATKRANKAKLAGSTLPAGEANDGKRG